MNFKKQNLIIITENYPYEGGEQFLYNEFVELSKHYKNLYIFPLNSNSPLIQNIPSNIVVNDSLSNEVKISKINLIKNFRFVFQLVLIELIINKNSRYFFYKLKYNLSTISQAIEMQAIFKKEVEKLKLSKYDTFGSTWMNIGAIVLSVSKFNKLISRFYFRINGFDIFDDRRLGNYMPFQAINFKHASKVIVLSEMGKNHILRKDIFPNKLEVNYSGLYDRGLNTLIEQSEFTIVSCSGLIELKRVDLIVKALRHINSNLTWIHFGDGPEMNKINELSKQLPSNITAKLMGATPNKDIIDFYKNNSVNLFIHTSKTEGLGMAIIEAQSFGIPALACNVGGVPEVVTNMSGTLMDSVITAKEVANEIIKFKDSHKNSLEFRKETKLHFLNKFRIDDNIKKFIDSIESNKH